MIKQYVEEAIARFESNIKRIEQSMVANQAALAEFKQLREEMNKQEAEAKPIAKAKKEKSPEAI